METTEFETWSELKERVLAAVEHGVDGVPMSNLWFRGHRRSDWSLTSSFDRIHSSVPLDRRLHMHDQMLKAFRERGRLVAEFDASMSENDLFAVLQHHGAPTKLLDWTTSPYVAAFFAFAGSVNVEAETDGADNCAIYLINIDAPIWQAGGSVKLVRASHTSDLRILNQRGFFTLNKSFDESLEDFISNYARTPQQDEHWIVQKWLVPFSEAWLGLRDLELMGISSETMFPGLDGSSRYAYFRATVAESRRG